MNPEGFAEYGKFKETTDLLFPNLPYLIDGDVKMSESMAILRFSLLLYSTMYSFSETNYYQKTVECKQYNYYNRQYHST